MRTNKATQIREITPDPKYKSVLVSQIVNRAMHDGKKSVTQRLVYSAMALIEAQTKRKPLEVLEAAIANITPQMEVRSRRVGGASYQVPMPVRTRRGASLSVRWLVLEANKRPNKQYHSFSEKLAAEILDASQNQGGAIEKRDTSHRMAESNKAFAHFRW
ncbi:MAG: 30S ribosomal protein S7 [Patescibacteria group bacterium]